METGIHELTAAYALDALDSDERRRYEEHLAGCERCRDELASFADVTAALAIAASGPEPRPELRDRILAQVRAEPQNVVPIRPRRRPFTPVLAVAAAAAAAVAIGVGIYAASLRGDLDDARATLEHLSDPGARTVALSGADGRLVVRPGGEAVLVVAGLPDSGETEDYEVWVIENDTPRRAGLFDKANDPTVVRVERPVRGGAVVAVTREKAGGVDRPTKRPVVTSRPV